MATMYFDAPECRMMFKLRPFLEFFDYLCALEWQPFGLFSHEQRTVCWYN